MEKISLYFEKLDFLTITFPKINLVSLIIIYILLLIIFKYKNKLLILFLVIFLTTLYFIPYKTNEVNIYFTDVSQGDSILITTKHLNKSILIDTGGILEYSVEEFKKRNKNYNLSISSLIPFYKSLGLKKIDYMFLTHGDEDHAGYAPSIIKNFKVSNIFINNNKINKLESNIINAKKFNQKFIKIDDVYLYSLNDLEVDDENKSSLVFLLKIQNFKILLMADASKEEEKEIIKKYNLKNIDILKLGHHGSKTSTSSEFLEETNPKYAVISVAKKNKFNHPSKEVISLLNSRNIQTLSTSNDGTINVIIKNNNISIKTYSP